MRNDKNKFMYYMAILILILSIIISILYVSIDVDNYDELNTSSYVNIKDYSGKWYSIFEFPNEFQKDCECVTAEYKLMQDYVEVKNTCGNTNKTINGVAYVLNNETNSELEVDFGFFRRGDYNILYVDDNYDYALVGSKDRKYLWFLSRTTSIENKYYYIMKDIATKEGYFNNNQELREVLHNCEE